MCLVVRMNLSQFSKLYVQCFNEIMVFPEKKQQHFCVLNANIPSLWHLTKLQIEEKNAEEKPESNMLSYRPMTEVTGGF